jgi:hypothetical protein
VRLAHDRAAADDADPHALSDRLARHRFSP